MMRKTLLASLIVLLSIFAVVPALLVNVGQAQALRYAWVRGVDPYWATTKFNFSTSYGRFETWFKRRDGLEIFGGSFKPNGTGFARVSWPIGWETAAAADPGSWGNITIVAKWGTWGGSQMIDGITVGMYNVSDPAGYEALHPSALAAHWYQVSIAWVEFHAHSWYNIWDNLSYAQVRFYENGTLFSGGQFLGGDVTSGAGDGNTTWQIVPLHHNITFLEDDNEYSSWYNFTNIAARVWWETVLVSNVTASTANITVGPTTGIQVIGGVPTVVATPFLTRPNGSNLFMNCSVFYASFRTFDSNDPAANDGPYIMEDARVAIHMLEPDDIAVGYYLTHNYAPGITNSSGVTCHGHSWKGGMAAPWSDWGRAMRFPNGTTWWTLADGYWFDGYRYDPRDARNTEAINDPTIFIDIPYMDTLTLTDDLSWGGMGIQVRWAGGLANSYGGAPVVVNYTHVPNPYYLAYKLAYGFLGLGGWIAPWDEGGSELGYGYAYGTIVQYQTNTDTSGPLPNGNLAAPGNVYNLNCSVFNVTFRVLDAAGNPLRYAEVHLTRLNGPPVQGETNASGLVGFWQLPGQMPPQVGFPPGFQAIYGLQIYYTGALLYVNTTVIDGLDQQIDLFNVTIAVISWKAHVLDCSDNELRNTAINYIHPTLGSIQTQTDLSGNIDFLATVQGVYNFTSAIWKLTEVPPISVKYPNGTTVLGGVVLVDDANLIPDPTGPIVEIRFALADIEITTWDADGEARIPYLNVTLTWFADDTLLTEGPFLMDPEVSLTDDDPRTPFPYEITYDEATATTIFHQMPSGVYNITVEVVSFGAGEQTPGYVWWQNITERVVWREFYTEFTLECASIEYDIYTWAYDWSWDTLDGGEHLDNVLVSIENDLNRIMFIGNSSSADDREFEIPDLSTDPLALIWWNGTYNMSIEYHTEFLGVTYDIFEVYNATNTPWMISDVHTMYLQENDHHEDIEVPVADIDLVATDKCGNLLYDPVIGNATVKLDLWEYAAEDGPGYYIVYSDLVVLDDTAAILWEHVPIAQWFNWTWYNDHGGYFYNFEIRILWWGNSSLVYFELFNLTKPAGFSGVACEVYDAEFILSVCRNADRPVMGLNATIYWHNYTRWVQFDEVGLNEPTLTKVYLVDNEEWPDGSEVFSMVPGPKFWGRNEDSPWDLYLTTGEDHMQPSDWTDNPYWNWPYYYYYHYANLPYKQGKYASNYSVSVVYDDFTDPDTDELYELVYYEDADLYFEFNFCNFSTAPSKVPIKLNATDFNFTALTSREENEVKVNYPVPNYVVQVDIDNGLTTISFTGRTDSLGQIHVISGDEPEEVIWGGSSITFLRVGPPPEYLNPGSDFWKTWLERNNVEFVDRTAQWTETDIPMSATTITKYTPGSPGTITVSPNEDFEGNAAEPGTHVPYDEAVHYTIVTVRPVDFNGRPLRGAWVQLIEQSSGLSAAWSYTNNSEIPEQSWNAGYTVMMNVSIIDYNEYIVRVYWLPEGVRKADGIWGTAVWPHDAVLTHPNVYDSWQDESDFSAKSIPVWWNVGYHADVTTFVYDLSLRFLYGEAVPIAVTVDVEPDYLQIKGVEASLPEEGTLKIFDLPRGVYVIKASYEGVAVASKTLDISESNVATVAADISVAVFDLSVTVRNAAGSALLPGAVLDISGPVSLADQTAVGGVLALKRLPTGTYTMDVEWAAPVTGNALVPVGTFTKDISVFKAEPDLFCNVFTISLRVSDVQGRPVSEAEISIGNAKATTDATGSAVFSLVPEGGYSLSVRKDTSDLGASPSSIDVSASALDFAIEVGKIFDLGVRVIGEQGQGLPYSTIYVTDPRTGATTTFTTDANGVMTIPSLMEGTYDVTAEYKGFRSESASVAVTSPGVTQEFKLPPYAEIFGVILTYWTFLAIVIGVILLIIVLAVLIHEYVTWRRRRLGIYLPTPPTKK